MYAFSLIRYTVATQRKNITQQKVKTNKYDTVYSCTIKKVSKKFTKFVFSQHKNYFSDAAFHILQDFDRMLTFFYDVSPCSYNSIKVTWQNHAFPWILIKITEIIYVGKYFVSVKDLMGNWMLISCYCKQNINSWKTLYKKTCYLEQ